MLSEPAPSDATTDEPTPRPPPSLTKPPSSRKRWFPRRRQIAVVVVLGYLAIMAFGGCADRLILFSSSRQIDPGPATQRFIDGDGKRLEIWTARADGQERAVPRAFVLEFCGNATRAEQIARFVADRWKGQSAEAWVVNYPGYGASEGGAKLKLIPPAALAAYDELKNVAGDRPIYLEANSLGTAAALYVAANRPVDGLVLQNPPPLQKLIVGRYGWWNLWLVAGPVSWQIPAELNSLLTAPKVTAPAVFLTADRDTLVPPSYQKRIIDAYSGPKRVITLKDTPHNAAVPQDAERQLLDGIEWLAARGND